MATAAFLTFSVGKSRFDRQLLRDEMRKSQYYRSTYSKNMSYYLRRLVKTQRLFEVATGVYQLPPPARRKFSLHFRDDATSVATQTSIDAATRLREHLPSIEDQDTQRFVGEAIGCIEHGLHRSAVILSWVGAVSVLHSHVLSSRLADFNSTASQFVSKWPEAKTLDDLCRMRESTFLEVLASLSIIGGDVKRELDNCLALRNSCSHPNSLRIAHAKVEAHVEVLLLNVFAKFKS